MEHVRNRCEVGKRLEPSPRKRAVAARSAPVIIEDEPETVVPIPCSDSDSSQDPTSAFIVLSAASSEVVDSLINCASEHESVSEVTSQDENDSVANSESEESDAQTSDKEANDASDASDVNDNPVPILSELVNGYSLWMDRRSSGKKKSEISDQRETTKS